MFKMTNDDYLIARIGNLFKAESTPLAKADMPRIAGLYQTVCDDVRAKWPAFSGDLPTVYVVDSPLLVQGLIEFPRFEEKCMGIAMSRHLLDHLADKEAKALLAHEMGHFLFNHLGVREQGFLSSPAVSDRKSGGSAQKFKQAMEREADSIAVKLYGIEALHDALFAVGTLHCQPRRLQNTFAKAVRRAAAIAPALGEVVLNNAGNGGAKDFHVPISKRLRWQKSDLKRAG